MDWLTPIKNANLPGTFKAWLSDSNQWPSNRFFRNPLGYVNIKGEVIANNWADLTDGLLENAIRYDEFGQPSLSPAPGWPSVAYTGTFTDGTSIVSQTCNNWTSKSEFGNALLGQVDSTRSSWANWSGEIVFCGDSPPFNAHLYCFQQ